MPPIPWALGVALAVTVSATIYLGIFPDQILRNTRDSAHALLSAASSGATEVRTTHF